MLCGRSRPMPLAHGLQPFPGEGPSARANHGGRCPQMQFFRPSKLINYHHFGRKIRLDESQKFGKKHDSNPNLCYCSARSDILKAGSFPFHKKRQPKQVRVNLYILYVGQVSAPYSKKIFTKAAFPFFAA